MPELTHYEANSIASKEMRVKKSISLGADDITPHSVVRTLLRSLDDSFDHIVLMIKERADFRSLVAADILERLNTFEMEEDEKHDINGSRRRSHALKAKASRCSSPEVSSASGVESDDAASIGKDLADRKSTRLNSSHMSISYAVFCLKKKK